MSTTVALVVSLVLLAANVWSGALDIDMARLAVSFNDMAESLSRQITQLGVAPA